MKLNPGRASLRGGKITQDLLTTLSYRDLNQNEADDFRPEDVILEDEYSDDEILKRFKADEGSKRKKDRKDSHLHGETMSQDESVSVPLVADRRAGL